MHLLSDPIDDGRNEMHVSAALLRQNHAQVVDRSDRASTHLLRRESAARLPPSLCQNLLQRYPTALDLSAVVVVVVFISHRHHHSAQRAPAR